MSYSYEQDPLLPKSKRSPEVRSRPESINDEYAKEELLEDERRPRRSLWNDVGAMILGLCIFSSLVMIFMPSNSPIDDRPVPKTISQRVNRILEDTPLIGQLIPFYSRNNSDKM